MAPKQYTLLFLLFGLLSIASAQERCGTVAYEKIRKQHHPNAETTDGFERWVKNKLAERSQAGANLRTQTLSSPYVIPVVIHVIHNGEAVGTGTNISDAQILSQIPVLNDDFQRLNADAINTLPEFQSVAGGLNIKFVMAQQAPNGQPTNGIVRVQGTQSSWSYTNDVTLKALSYWPAENYFNIWVTNLNGGLLGYTQLPISPGSPNDLPGLDNPNTDRLTDGVVVHYATFGTASAVGGSGFTLLTEYNRGRTATHEIGHFFGLRHIWGDDNGACTGSDYVDDTPNQADSYNGKCPSGTQQSCSTDNMYQNYMDYTDDACMNLFSQGQDARMTIIIENAIRRASLLTSPGATNPSSTLSPFFVNSTQISLKVTKKAIGTNCAVFIKAASSDAAAPVNNTTYTPNTALGAGSQIGATGWYCVYNSNSSGQMDITSLTAGTTYSIQVVDYNGTAGTEQYISSTNPGTLIQVPTFPVSPDPTYSFQAASDSFTPLVAGTVVNSIATDEAISSSIPIGFDFFLGGEAFNSLTASSNGFLSFNPYLSDSYNANSLLSSYAKPAVAPLWDDLDGTGGQASYLISGQAPNRVFTFEFLNWRWNHTATSAGISFQVKLHETSSQVDLIFRQEAGTVVSPNAKIGLAFAALSGNYSFLSLSDATPGPNTSGSIESPITTSPASGQRYTFTPVKFNQTVTFNALPAHSYGDAPFTLVGSSSSGLPISYTSSDPGVASIGGNILTIMGAGTATITASQNGDGNYNAATPVEQPITVSKISQTISFSPIPPKTFGDPTFTISASSTSQLALTYSSSNTSVATISSAGDVTITGVGNTDITVSQAGSGGYYPATSVVQTLTVNKAAQAITFSSIPTKVMGDSPIQLSAVASSSLPVAFSSSSSKISIIGTAATILQPGAVTIQADQPGNNYFNAAPTASQAFCINPAKPVITITGLNTGIPVLLSSSTSGNQWYKNGVIITGATSTSYTPTETNLYTVIATVDNCSSTPSDMASATVTGIEDLSPGITFSPNPTDGELRIELANMQSQDSQVYLYDMVGRMVDTVSGGTLLYLNLYSYSKGSYIVKVQNGSHFFVQHIIKR